MSDRYTPEEKQAVLDAMSVVPIAWLTAEQIIGEMFIHGDGRTILPILKALLAEGLVTRDSTVKPTGWRISDQMVEEVTEAWERHGGPVWKSPMKPEGL